MRDTRRVQQADLDLNNSITSCAVRGGARTSGLQRCRGALRNIYMAPSGIMSLWVCVDDGGLGASNLLLGLTCACLEMGTTPLQSCSISPRLIGWTEMDSGMLRMVPTGTGKWLIAGRLSSTSYLWTLSSRGERKYCRHRHCEL